MALELLIGAFGNQFVKNYLLPSFFRPSVRPSVHVRILPRGEHRDCHRTNFLEISCFELLLNFVNKFRFSFKVLTKTEYLTQIPTYVRAICLYNTDTVLCEVRTEHNS